jgi:hypothetical protein
MMDAMEREQALRAMRASADAFYRTAVQIGVHPFIEFSGLMNEYLLACAQAHAQGIDFSECNRHSGQALPLHPVMSDYINEKLECIFSGAKVLDVPVPVPVPVPAPESGEPPQARTMGISDQHVV